MTEQTASLPLAGVRVLDLSRVLAGPWCAMVLGDLGAEVIKVEHPERGDDTRDWGLKTGETTTAYFDSVNRNKTSVSIDLASPEGREKVLALAAQADVVIQNFKAGGADKLGLGYDALRAVNPRLVYCTISGYAPDGPEAKRPGYDLVVQGEAGLMAMNGEPDQERLKFGVAIVDIMTGQYAAQAVLAALLAREKTGQGRHVSLNLFDCGVTLTSYYGLEALVMQQDPPRYGNAHPSIMPYGVFSAADGPIVITVGNNPQFQRFCNHVIERPEIAADPRFATNIKRAENRADLGPLLKAEIARHTRRDLTERLRAQGIPCGEVLGLLEALTSARAQAAEVLVSRDNPDGTVSRVIAPPFRFDGKRVPVRHMPPPLAPAE